MKRKMFLTVAAVAAVAVGAQAQAQFIQAPAGQAYTIISTADATAVNRVTYQWYRDNNPIPSATSASYTVPKQLAYGDNVQFYRLAKTQDCTGDVEKPSNIVTITFTGFIMPEGVTLVIDGLCWASANVDIPQTFATRPDMYTKFYQWNSMTAYSANDPLTPEWNATADQSATWTVNPCPLNWRMPSADESQQLHNSGTTWADVNTRGNLVAGRFYGYNHATCQLPNNMSGCVFISASGYRMYTDGTLSSQGAGGLVWTSTQESSASGRCLRFIDTSSSPTFNNPKGYGFNIRCVK